MKKNMRFIPQTIRTAKNFLSAGRGQSMHFVILAFCSILLAAACEKSQDTLVQRIHEPADVYAKKSIAVFSLSPGVLTR